MNRRQTLAGMAALGTTSVPSASTTDPLDTALRRFHATDAEFRGGLSNHGPMASEALEALGFPERIPDFVDKYAQRLEPAEAGEVLTQARFDAALGRPDARADLIATMVDRLGKSELSAVLPPLLATLMPGLVAAAFHGPLRAAHALRGLSRRQSPERLAEVAHGLGYWASRFAPLPGRPGARAVAGRTAIDALADVPLLDEDQRSGGLILDRFAPLAKHTGYIEAVEAFDPDAQPVDEVFDDLSAAAARLYLGASSGRSRFVYLHGITGTAAIRSLLPRLSADQRRLSVGHLFAALAAVFATHGEPDHGLGRAWPTQKVDTASLAQRAAASKDDHTIKLVEACLREFARSRRPELLAVAAHRLR
ncbi:MAG: questin oxidase family protein [Myxococcota bacterium]